MFFENCIAEKRDRRSREREALRLPLSDFYVSDKKSVANLRLLNAIGRKSFKRVSPGKGGLSGFIPDQAYKGARWMPWHHQAKKDVVSCDKLRVVANTHRSGDFRMGQPGRDHTLPSVDQFIVHEKRHRGK